jgi:hypothetical protein
MLFSDEEMGKTTQEKPLRRSKSRRPKPAAKTIQTKFAEGERVKPTAEAIRLGWTKPGVVVRCGVYAVAVQMDEQQEYDWYATDYWTKETAE